MYPSILWARERLISQHAVGWESPCIPAQVPPHPIIPWKREHPYLSKSWGKDASYLSMPWAGGNYIPACPGTGSAFTPAYPGMGGVSQHAPKLGGPPIPSCLGSGGPPPSMPWGGVTPTHPSMLWVGSVSVSQHPLGQRGPLQPILFWGRGKGRVKGILCCTFYVPWGLLPWGREQSPAPGGGMCAIGPYHVPWQLLQVPEG